MARGGEGRKGRREGFAPAAGLSLAALLAALAGCAPPPEPAPVRIRAGAADLASAVVPRFAASSPPTALKTGAAGGWEATPARRLYLGDNRQALAEAQARLGESRERAYGQILERLRRALDRDLEQLTRERGEAWEVQRLNHIAAAFAGLEAAFAAHAAGTAPILLDLANLAGWPDPDPRSRRPVPHDRHDPTASLARARDLRTALAARDAEWNARAEAAYAAARAAAEADLEALRAEIDAERRRRTEEAAALARARVPIAADGGAQRRLDQPLPALPAESVVLPPVAPVRWPLPAARPADPRIAADRRAEAAEIYTAVHRTRPARPGEPADDRTSDFESWLNPLPGP